MKWGAPASIRRNISGGESLLDIRVCFGRDLFPIACDANEDQAWLGPAAKIDVPPVTR